MYLQYSQDYETTTLAEVLMALATRRRLENFRCRFVNGSKVVLDGVSRHFKLVSLNLVAHLSDRPHRI